MGGQQLLYSVFFDVSRSWRTLENRSEDGNFLSSDAGGHRNVKMGKPFFVPKISNFARYFDISFYFY
jgi:hypothetical protein